MIGNIMKKLLSLVLIASLLTSSVSPAFAQLRPVSNGVKAVKSGNKAIKASTQVPGEVMGTVTQVVKIPSHISLSPTAPVTHLYTDVSRQAARQQMAFQGSADQLQALVRSGQLNGLATTIINLPADNSQKAALLRNEFVTTALAGFANQEQLHQALKFYRTDLSERAKILADIPAQPLPSLLLKTAPEELETYREILSSAAALALLGDKADAPLLLAFWENVANSPFREIGAAIVGRGLLRTEAYAWFNVWSNTLITRGDLWMGFDAYAVAHDLPIGFLPQAGATPRPAQVIADWLGEGCAVNALSADPSLAATEKWMSLGKDPALLAQLTQQDLAAKSLPSATPSSNLSKAD